MNDDKLRGIAQHEFDTHNSEYHRLQSVVDRLLTTMEYHGRQMGNWQGYLEELGGVAVDHTADVIPLPRRPELRIIPGGAPA